MNAKKEIIASMTAIILQETIVALAGPGTTPMLMNLENASLKAPSPNRSS